MTSKKKSGKDMEKRPATGTRGRRSPQGKKILAVGKRMFPFGTTGWGWDPILCLRSISLTMDALYGELFQKSQSFIEETFWEPPVDMYTHEGRLHIEIELPGMSKENISLHATSTLLIIDGKNERYGEIREKDFTMEERKFGHFYRSIPLPCSILPEEMRAELKDGILRVIFPYKKEVDF